MWIPGRALAQGAFRRARSRLLGGVPVLGYHRVGGGADPLGLAVSERNFAQHLDVIARRAAPVRLSEAVQAVAAGRLPRRAVAVTFDDGYRDTYESALPLLERAGVPATVFVTTGCPGREFWWNELGRILMETRPLPERLTLDIGRRPRTWSFDGVPGTKGRDVRRDALTGIARELQGLRPSQRDELLAVVRAWAGQPAGGGPAAAVRALTTDEIRQLAAGRNTEIGAHTVSHPVLTALDPAEQRREVLGCRTHLEQITGTAVTTFSYPHGACCAATRAIVAEAGFTIACTSTPDVLRWGTDVFAVPRLWVGDMDGHAFARWLDGWLDG